jgi:subtilisin family serine protease
MEQWMSHRRSRFGRIALIILGLALMGSGSGRSERRQAFVDPLLGRMMRASEDAARDTGRPEAIPSGKVAFFEALAVVGDRGDGPAVRVRLRLDAAARHSIEALGIRTYGRLEGFASALVPMHRLAAIAALPGVEAMQAIRLPETEINVSRAEVLSTQVETTYASRGKGVIVASVDTGIDWRHHDFRKPDGTTRIKYIWNQDDACLGTTPPFPFNFGCLYTEAQINAALTGGPTITAPDAEGHGTHTMGVAAGNGRATGQGFPALRYVGMAPEADIIMVKTFKEPGDASTCDQCGDIGAGIDFIDAKAAELGKPYVINLSLGLQYGGHDGSDLDEMTIDTLVGSGIPGKAVVKSAGNDRTDAIHIGGTVAANQTNTHNFTIPSYTPSPFIDAVAWSLWYSGGDNLTVTISDPTTASCSGTQTLSMTTGQGQAVRDSTSGFLFIDDAASPAPNGARFFEMDVDDQGSSAPCSGTWQLSVRGNTITAGGRYDAWIYFNQFGASAALAAWASPDPSRVISIPGTAFDVSTVGAYTSKLTWKSINGGTYQFSGSTPVGALTWFSSAGPTRDGRLKPDISAPGSAIVSSLSIDAAPTRPASLIVEDGVHAPEMGTSFSSPHVAGIYAQILALNPYLDAIDLRALATGSARFDGNTGSVPNNDWGYGKVSALGMAGRAVQNIPDVTASGTGTFAWTPLGTANTYNAYRGSLLLKAPGYYGTCLAWGLPSATFSDTASPPTGAGYFYHVTGVWNGIEGILGYTSSGVLRVNSSPCP